MKRRAVCVSLIATIAALVGSLVYLYFAGRTTSRPDIDVRMLEYSPDGRFISVVIAESENTSPYRPRPEYTTNVFDVTGNQKQFELHPGGLCSWSQNGDRVAIACVVRPPDAHGQGDVAAPTIEVRRSGTWQHLQTLTFPNVGSKSSTDVQGLCFDRFNNLYATRLPALLMTDELPDTLDLTPLMWAVAGPAGNLYSAQARKVGHDRPCHIATSSHGDDARLAISYLERNSIEVYRVRQKDQREVTISLEFEIPAEEGGYIRLSPDGQFLAVKSTDQFKLFKMDSAGATEIKSIQEDAYAFTFRQAIQTISISGNGRQVAATWPMARVVRVFNTNDGKQVLELPGIYWTFALSPDGSELVVPGGRGRGFEFHPIP